MKRTIKTLYFSPTNGTKKIVRAIASSIQSEYTEYDITLPEQRKAPIHFTENDLVIIGLPTYAGRVPKLLLPFLSSITGNNALCVCVATYGNRDYEDALLEQYDLFTQRGFTVCSAATFVTEHSATNKLATARPNAEDLTLAAEFGSKILNSIATLSSSGPISLSLPGHRPYVEKNIAMPPMTPETTEACIKCGFCAKHCPTGAIDFESYTEIKSESCIKCNSCVKRCPVHAKSITHEAYHNMQTMLIQNFSTVQKKPEFFMA